MQQDVSGYYALDIGGMNFILAYFTHLLTVEKKNLLPKELIARYKRSRNALLGIAIIFVVSAIPQFWTWPVDGFRIILWILTIPLTWVTRIAGRRAEAKGEHKA